MKWLARIPLVRRRVCLICGRLVIRMTRRHPGVYFRCFDCGLSGLMHGSCIGLPPLSEAISFMGGGISDSCPQCIEAASRQVLGIPEELIDEITGVVCRRSQEWTEQPRECFLLPEPTPDPWLREIAGQLRTKGGEDLLKKVSTRVVLKASLTPADKGYFLRVWDMWDPLKRPLW